MRIIFFGTPDFVIPVLKKLIDTFTVVGVVTGPDQITGRKKLLTPSPVKQFAIERAIPAILTPQQFNHETISQLQTVSPDLFIVAAYGKIIPQSVLDLSKYGSLNIHPSHLPKYRGPSPIQSTLLAGEKEIGLSIIKMDEKMDHGPLIYQKDIPLLGNETFAMLHQSLFQEAADALPNIIEAYVTGKSLPKEQDHTEATYCHMITKESGYIDSENPPDHKTIDRMIRAFYPWPTAWTRVRIMNHESRIMKLLPNNMFQLEGGVPIRVKELLNGHPELTEQLEKFGLRTKN